MNPEPVSPSPTPGAIIVNKQRYEDLVAKESSYEFLARSEKRAIDLAYALKGDLKRMTDERDLQHDVKNVHLGSLKIMRLDLAHAEALLEEEHRYHHASRIAARERMNEVLGRLATAEYEPDQDHEDDFMPPTCSVGGLKHYAEGCRHAEDRNEFLEGQARLHNKALANAHLDGYRKGLSTFQAVTAALKRALDTKSRLLDEAKKWKHRAQSAETMLAEKDAYSRRPDAVIDRLREIIAERVVPLLDEIRKAYCCVCRNEAIDCVCRNARDRG